MTAQEEQLISDLARQIHSAPPPQIDRDADHLIQSTIGTRPDALYILVQTVLMQQLALNQQQPSRFLPDQQPPLQYQDPQYQQPHGGMFSNFLHNAAATAAGVIAGDMVFDSLASIFGGHRGGGGFFGGSNFMDGGGNTVDRGGNDDSQFASVADQNQDISPDIDDERDA